MSSSDTRSSSTSSLPDTRSTSTSSLPETMGKLKLMEFLDEAEHKESPLITWKRAALVTAAVIAIIASLFAVVAAIRTISDILSKPIIIGTVPVTIVGEQGIQNETLGFEKIYVLNMPTRPDQRDVLTVAASVSNLKFDFYAGAAGDSIPDKGLPEGASDLNPGARGEWIAQMSIYQHMVDNNIASALILEDDVDWDVRIREQLEAFAKASRVLGERAAKPNHADAEAIHFEDLDDHDLTASSPFGDKWDVLWLGHLGARMPGDDDDSKQIKHRDYVVRHNDSTVTQYSQQNTLDNSFWNVDLADRPDHTRLYHAAVQGVGTQGYAISLRGARRALYALELEQPMEPIDIALRVFCENLSGKGETPICIATSPSLFSQYKSAGNTAKDSNIGDFSGGVRDKAWVANLKYSVRDNLAELISGGTEFVDRYPDQSDDRQWTDYD